MQCYGDDPGGGPLAAVTSALAARGEASDGGGTDAFSAGVHVLGRFGEFLDGEVGSVHGVSEWLAFALASEFWHVVPVPGGVWKRPVSGVCNLSTVEVEACQRELSRSSEDLVRAAQFERVS